MLKNLRRAQNALSQVYCMKEEHEKQLYRIYMDKSEEIHLICSECILRQIVPENQIVSTFDTNQFLAHLVKSHGLILFKEKLVSSPDDCKRLLSFTNKYIEKEKEVQESSLSQLKKEIGKIKEECRENLEKRLLGFEKEAIEYFNLKFKKASLAFYEMKELLDPENTFYEEIGSKSQKELKELLKNFLKVQKARANSKEVERQLAKSLEEVMEKSQYGMDLIKEVIPKFSGIIQHSVKLKNALFHPGSTFDREVNACLEHTFEAPVPIIKSEEKEGKNQLEDVNVKAKGKKGETVPNEKGKTSKATTKGKKFDSIEPESPLKVAKSLLYQF